MRISIVVAYDETRLIGRAGDLPWRLPADLAYFKSLTMGHHLVLGRKTFDSIGRALPGRHMITVSRGQPLLPEGVVLANSLEEALDIARAAGEDEAFVAGGGEIYRQALKRANRIYVSHVGSTLDSGQGEEDSENSQPGDVRFPAWDAAQWVLTSCDTRIADEKNPRDIDFCIYDRTE